jgi:cyclopropane fatty-acyl-phospholipid synthase-like methyltransferase
MATETGVWSQEEANTGHLFSYRLAQYIGKILRNNKSLPVFDFGCGTGAYVRYLKDIGFRNVTGVEGRSLINFEISEEEVFIQDLTTDFDLIARGHVICLEVAEHIPSEYTSAFIENITKHVDKNCFLILSWAVPGQDGYGHVNCKQNEEVIRELYFHGFELNQVKTAEAREVIEGPYAYFKETILIFQRS